MDVVLAMSHSGRDGKQHDGRLVRDFEPCSRHGPRARWSCPPTPVWPPGPPQTLSSRQDQAGRGRGPVEVRRLPRWRRPQLQAVVATRRPTPRSVAQRWRFTGRRGDTRRTRASTASLVSSRASAATTAHDLGRSRSRTTVAGKVLPNAVAPDQSRPRRHRRRWAPATRRSRATRPSMRASRTGSCRRPWLAARTASGTRRR
jgi:hypothetical protein